METDGGDGSSPDEFIEYLLDGFTAYTAGDYKRKLDPKTNRMVKTSYPFKFPWEMIRLSALKIAPNIDYLLVDGFVVGSDGERRWVERLKCNVLNVEYADDLFVEPKLWLQSMANSAIVERLCPLKKRRRQEAAEPRTPFDVKRANTWYRIGSPSPEYARYFEPFLWLASFGIFFQAFVNHVLSQGRDVLLLEFRRNFHDWLQAKFQEHENKQAAEPRFRRWMENAGNATDFRNMVTAHKDWLWNQSYTDKDIASITLWKEIHNYTAIKPPYSGPHEMKTVVTPYVYSVFKDMYGEHLKKVIPKPEVPKQLLGVVVRKPKTMAGYVPQVGDCVAFAADEGGAWKAKRSAGNHSEPDGWSDDLWFGYVTKIVDKRVYIVWLYRPNDTVLRGAKYPWSNELFFSDHCNCGPDSQPLLIRDILGKIDVVFRPKPEEMSEAGFFIRQKYRTEDPAFLTLKHNDYAPGRCACDENSLTKEESFERLTRDFPVGSTVLYEPKNGKLLEPGIVLGWNGEDQTMLLRQLPRLEILQKDAAPNEVVFSSVFLDIHQDRIIRRCFVRVFQDLKSVVAPYDRRGIGDCFFIRYEIAGNGGLQECQLEKDELRPGYSLQEPIDKPILRGMDLFCGGGNFGRGLEEGGAIQMKWAVDFDSIPLHNYRANLKDLGDTKLYLGSINNYLQDAIRGKFSEEKGIPERDQVDFISAGSPCQGFSLANAHKKSFEAQRKQSLVASLATAIDIYRPKYAVLENVSGIGHSRLDKDGKTVNTYATMLCAIVGLGYQAESYLADAWSHGNCQSRTRLILAITKDGYEPIGRPTRSHPHPAVIHQTGIYEAPNGKKFGSRHTEGLTPFRFCSIISCWAPLPNIGDGHVGLSIRYPDHICASAPDTIARLIMSKVPRFDQRKSWRSAIDSGRLHPTLWTYPQEGEKLNEDCRTYSRVPEYGLCRTLTTTPTPQCTRTGRWMHHSENRLITIQEARVAQGYPDDEPLVGQPNKRLHVIGNSVARGVSLAIGIRVRESYLNSSVDAPAVQPRSVNNADYEIVDESMDEDSQEDVPSGPSEQKEPAPSSLKTLDQKARVIETTTIEDDDDEPVPESTMES
ncbi:S-adenosyl-L-methionine-dependent methyltransferase [Sphaerosporella brunnea]|uniref:DNA (cytosine-5-)-methyltransferase n=1 Tax=Sphaerosporella brunnea TaxID=1250544 RepID=A0A5J5EH41_9PEZI|nr:S-adenosyl-L-methionine-dependent methyltransferase [Sphaerosporella brunnea]